MLLSKSCEYGLRTALHLAANDSNGEYVAIRTISEELNIPYHFLAKVAQHMIAADLLTSVRGPRGGVALARPAEAITLGDIVTGLDGTDLFTECVLGLPECGNRKPCPLHASWAEARGKVLDMFSGASLADLARDVTAGKYRLSEPIVQAA